MSHAAAAPAYHRLHERFATAGKLAGAKTLLWWDSQTYMPRGAAPARGEQLAALDDIVFDLLAAPELADWLGEAESAAGELGAAERANLREMRRAIAHTTGVPRELRAAKSRLAATLQADWARAKAAKDFSLFAPGFGRMLSLHREIAAAKSEALGLEPYDALMDEADPGVTTALVDPLFAELARSLPELLAEVVEAQASRPPPIPFSGDFSIERQRVLAERLLGLVGQGTEHSRFDTAPHPFAVPGTPGDARIATRFDPANFRFSILAVLHEAGHAAYEFNLPRALSFQPVGAARGATSHESQSLMLEMQAGRSAEFLSWLAPVLHETFGGDPEAWSPENVLAAWRGVGEGFIRVEADEISYPLHVILRYRLERALLAGDLAAAEIPGAWTSCRRNSSVGSRRMTRRARCRTCTGPPDCSATSPIMRSAPPWPPSCTTRRCGTIPPFPPRSAAATSGPTSPG
jgi:carboxypeptidase Taq